MSMTNTTKENLKDDITTTTKENLKDGHNKHHQRKLKR
jgi:hypothetical protein